MAGGAQAAIGVFRKTATSNCKKSKYEAIVKTTEMLETEAMEKATQMDEDEAVVAVQSTKTTKETMDELAAMTEKMTLEKKMRKRRANKKTDTDMDVDADVPKISIKSKAIGKKKDRFKKSRKQLLHQWSNYLEHTHFIMTLN